MCSLAAYLFSYPEALLLICIFSMLFSLCLVMLMQKCGRSWRARRNQRELDKAFDEMISRGFRRFARGYVKGEGK